MTAFAPLIAAQCSTCAMASVAEATLLVSSEIYSRVQNGVKWFNGST